MISKVSEGQSLRSLFLLLHYFFIMQEIVELNDLFAAIWHSTLIKRHDLTIFMQIQSWENFFVRGLANCVPVVACHLWLDLPTTFSQPRTKKFFCSVEPIGVEPEPANETMSGRRACTRTPCSVNHFPVCSWCKEHKFFTSFHKIWVPSYPISIRSEIGRRIPQNFILLSHFWYPIFPEARSWFFPRRPMTGTQHACSFQQPPT